MTHHHHHHSEGSVVAWIFGIMFLGGLILEAFRYWYYWVPELAALAAMVSLAMYLRRAYLRRVELQAAEQNQAARLAKLGAGSSLRCTQAQRDLTTDRLARNYGAGSLDQEEYDRRITAALGAVHQSDLSRLMTDLPVV